MMKEEMNKYIFATVLFSCIEYISLHLAIRHELKVRARDEADDVHECIRI